MKYIDEYRDPETVRNTVAAIGAAITRPWTIMEVCGGQTHSIVRFGLDELLPDGLELVHGPGCPVCVTPLELIDKALAIAARPDVIFCSFGDMLRVPGSRADLFAVKARGGDVRIVYSPLDALTIARDNPDRQVVFFAVGFETTAPANALAVVQAQRAGVDNFSLLVSHVRVPPAIEVILSAEENRVQGFLAAGHVCTVMGYEEYFELAERFESPIVVTGFEPVDILQGIYMCVRQLEQGRHEVENQYSRVVRKEGTLAGRALIEEVFEIADRAWRGIGVIPQSGYRLAPELARFDAEQRFDIDEIRAEECPDCQSGLVLQGVKKPTECPAFGNRCTPESPLGATMVSTEGACAAYYRYKRRSEEVSA